MGGKSSKDIFFSSFEALKEENLDQKPDEFWEPIWTSPLSVEDIFSLTIDQIREFKRDHPQNLTLLIEKIVFRLMKFRQNYVEAESMKLLNCIRLLLRLIPVIFEDQQDGLHISIFWNKKFPAPASQLQKQQQQTSEKTVKGSKLEEVDPPTDEIREGEQKTTAVPPLPSSSTLQPLVLEPLAVRLLKTLVELLFLPGFTIDQPTSTSRTGFLLPLDHIWATGVGSSEVMSSTNIMLTRRTEVLKCLLICFCESLYLNSEKIKSTENRWLHFMACNSTYYSLGFFYSLLNVGCNYDPIGWGIPYNHLMSTDYQEELTDLSLQILALLLNYHPLSSKTNQQNIFIGYIKSIYKKEEFKFLTDAFVKLLNNPLQANRTYLPHSTKSIECHHEILMLFWKLLQYNKAYLEYLCLHPDVLKIITPILHFILEGRKEISQVQLVQLASFVLLIFSGERDFSVLLNTVYLEKPPAGIPVFTGNHADFLLLVIHKLFVDSHEKLIPFFECFLTIVANISPYIKSLSMVTSITLLKLFEFVSRPRFLFASETNYRYSVFILEIFNNIIQYQYEGNSKLVYSILRHAVTFQKLSNIQLSDQVKSKKKEEEKKPETNETPSTMEKLESEEHNQSNSFQPTQEWLESWKQQLPINIPLKLIEALEPKIQALVSGSAEDEHHILIYLQNSTIVGILPVPHPIVIRKYVDNNATNEWFTLFAYGVIVKRSYSPPTFANTKISLFTIQANS